MLMSAGDDDAADDRTCLQAGPFLPVKQPNDRGEKEIVFSSIICCPPQTNKLCFLCKNVHHLPHNTYCKLGKLLYLLFYLGPLALYWHHHHTVATIDLIGETKEVVYDTFYCIHLESNQHYHFDCTIGVLFLLNCNCVCKLVAYTLP